MKKCLFIIYLGGSIILFNREKTNKLGDKIRGREVKVKFLDGGVYFPMHNLCFATNLIF